MLKRFYMSLRVATRPLFSSPQAPGGDIAGVLGQHVTEALCESDPPKREALEPTAWPGPMESYIELRYIYIYVYIYKQTYICMHSFEFWSKCYCEFHRDSCLKHLNHALLHAPGLLRACLAPVSGLFQGQLWMRQLEAVSVATSSGKRSWRRSRSAVGR